VGWELSEAAASSDRLALGCAGRWDRVAEREVCPSCVSRGQFRPAQPWGRGWARGVRRAKAHPGAGGRPRRPRVPIPRLQPLTPTIATVSFARVVVRGSRAAVVSGATTSVAARVAPTQGCSDPAAISGCFGFSTGPAPRGALCRAGRARMLGIRSAPLVRPEILHERLSSLCPTRSSSLRRG